MIHFFNEPTRVPKTTMKDTFYQIILAVTVILTQLFNKTNASIQCYKCTTTKPSPFSNETQRLCTEFDFSERFIVNCPFSSFCMKRYYTIQITPTQLINATERDCAHQSYTTQTLRNGQWHKEILIEEPYQEGCSTVDDKGIRTSKTIDCYCKSYLCNVATIINCNYYQYFIIVIMTVINLV